MSLPQTFMVTWGVSEEFGGMTSVCLDRSRMFQAHTGAPAPVLTFEEAARDPHNLANSLYRADPFPQPNPVVNFDPPAKG